MRKTLLTLFALACLTASAQTTFTEGKLQFTTLSASTAGVSETEGIVAGDVITVPETVTHNDTTYTVTAILSDAFKYDDLAACHLPSTVVSIGSSAFSSCDQLAAIDLPAGLKSLGSYCFSGAALTSITIPDGVREIPTDAFFMCKKLTSIDLGKGVETIGDGAFYKTGLTSITLPETMRTLGGAFQGSPELTTVVLNEGLDSIGKYCFRECKKLASITLPSTVRIIGGDAFLECRALRSINIPAALEELGTNFVANSSVETITVDPACVHFKKNGECVYSADGRILYVAPVRGLKELTVPAGCVGIYGGAFSASDIQRVVLPEGFLAIDDFAFCESSLAEINLPATIKMIGEQAFASTGLRDVRFPDSTTTVADGVLAGCTSLRTVTLPAAVSMVLNHAFLNCTNLESVTCLGQTAPDIDDVYDDYDSPFYAVSSSVPVYVPVGCADEYKSKGWGSYLTITESELATAITRPDAQRSAGVRYTLSGRRAAKGYRGIVVEKGRKTLVR